MRISDDRYSRDRLRFDVAVQFIRHEARTRTIRQWTGLSDDRIRKLYRSYLSDATATPPVRHRGKSPQTAAFFTRNHRTRAEASLLASLCCTTGAMPESATPEQAQSLPSLGRAELLCQAYGVYRAAIADAIITFEHAVFLLTALVRGDELRLDSCRGCAAYLIVDRWSLRSPRCALCSADQASAAASASVDAVATHAGPMRGLQDWRAGD